jgi:hypothetical protein
MARTSSLPALIRRYTTIVCNIMARKDADRKGGGPRYACSDTVFPPAPADAGGDELLSLTNSERPL